MRRLLQRQRGWVGAGSTDGMMHLQMMAEFSACVEELSYAHPCGTLTARAGCVKELPGLPEGVMEHFHRGTHSTINFSVLTT